VDSRNQIAESALDLRGNGRQLLGIADSLDGVVGTGNEGHIHERMGVAERLRAPVEILGHEDQQQRAKP
jgi:hypothetical protein